MKHLVRNKTTQSYLCADGTWSQDYSSAASFEDTKSVLKAIRAFDTTKLEVILMMGQKPSSLDVVLRLFSE
jgi:hypothetical protein